VDGFSHFSRLLDANFEALHGSLSSVLRLIEVFGEFFFVVKTFSLFRFLFGSVSSAWNGVNRLAGRGDMKQLEDGARKFGNNFASAIDFSDFTNFQNRGRQKLLSFILLVLGLSAPVLLIRVWNKLRSGMPALDSNHIPENKMENAWPTNSGTLLRALYDFRGENEGDLVFKQNDAIKLLAKPFAEWWEGELLTTGQRGIFPANFVEEKADLMKKDL